MAAPMAVDMPINVDKKVKKKLQRCRHTLRKLDNVNISEEPTNILCVFNGGLDTGVSREEIQGLFCEDVNAEDIIMLPQRPYAFICYLQVEDALQVCNKLNGTKLANGNQLYISFLKYIPTSSIPSTELPPGLILLKDVVNEDYEKQLIDTVEWNEEDNPAQRTLKHRRVKHYGYEFMYGINNVDPKCPLPNGIPPVCDELISLLLRLGVITQAPNQLTVNQYLPGQGIPPHVDTPSAFENGIISLSLGSQAVMEFHHPDGRHRSVVLPRRSLIVMTGESRYTWSHGITPRKSDIIPLQDGALTLVKRETRVSFTFRKLASENPVQIPESLTSLEKTSVVNGINDAPSIPLLETKAAELEATHVHQVYNEIADHFSSTRHSPWPKVTEFLCSLQPSALVADIGCGNGKYFGLNPSIFQIGSDRSESLVEICRERNFQAFVGDILAIPLKSNTFDACICIAVIHHLSTKQRRIQAIKELVRLLRPGGTVLIQVWAMEQERDKQKSKYIKKKSNVPCKDNENKEGKLSTTPTDTKTVSTDSKLFMETSRLQISASESSKEADIAATEMSPNKDADATSNESSPAEPKKLAIHVNRTTFKQQDLLVPWTKKVKKTNDDNNTEGTQDPVLYRYYHVFQRGELEELCRTIDSVDVTQSYYDEGNWCIVLTKQEL